MAGGETYDTPARTAGARDNGTQDGGGTLEVAGDAAI
jgi:hypothetical protein